MHSGTSSCGGSAPDATGCGVPPGPCARRAQLADEVALPLVSVPLLVPGLVCLVTGRCRSAVALRGDLVLPSWSRLKPLLSHPFRYRPAQVAGPVPRAEVS